MDTTILKLKEKFAEIETKNYYLVSKIFTLILPEYQAFTASTFAPTPDYIRHASEKFLYLSIGDQADINVRWELSHCFLGLAGELVEVDVEWEKKKDDINPVLKEIGDIFYYLSRIYDIIGIYDYNSFLEAYHLEDERDLWVNSLNKILSSKSFAYNSSLDILLDYSKRLQYYGQEFTPQMRVQIQDVLMEILIQINFLFIRLDKNVNVEPAPLVAKIILANVEKLQKRYPNKSFSVQDSISKKDAANE